MRKIFFSGTVEVPQAYRVPLRVRGAVRSKVKVEGITRQLPTLQPLNLKFKSFNSTTSKKQYDIRDVSSILYNLRKFLEFSKHLKKFVNFC